MAVFSCEKGDIMKKPLFLSFILYSLFVASPMPAAAESQTWKVRPGDNLDIIATILEIPREEIKTHNPGVLERVRLWKKNWARKVSGLESLKVKTVIWRKRSLAQIRSCAGIPFCFGDSGFVSALSHS